MNKIALVGAGLVGRGWAIVFARAGWNVALFDAAEGATRDALEIISARLEDLETAGLVARAGDVRQRIVPASSLADALAGAQFVQESAAERLEVKRAVFAELDRLADPAAVLASSSSAIPAPAFTADLAGRRRCLIAHPVNPPYLIPLVELSPAPWTASEVLEQTQRVMSAVGQAPIIVKREIQGFVLNRLQGALLHEAFRLVEDGVADVDDVDIAVREGLGLRWSFMGPFETIDLNAPGGVADYVRRYGEMYYEMGQSQAVARHWEGELVKAIETARRTQLPESELAARQAWRDRRLMALAAHKASQRGTT